MLLHTFIHMQNHSSKNYSQRTLPLKMVVPQQQQKKDWITILIANYSIQNIQKVVLLEFFSPLEWSSNNGKQTKMVSTASRPGGTDL